MDEKTTSITADLLKALTDLGTAISTPKTFAESAEFAVIPHGYKVQPLQELLGGFMDRPLRLCESMSFKTPDSFIAYINRFKQPSTTLFGDPVTLMVSAVLDYHESGDAPTWGMHLAKVSLTRTPEWSMWLENNKKHKDQVTFAEFLEDAAMWINKPPAADLLAISRHMSARRNMEFDSSVNMQDGSIQFKYIDEAKPGSIEVPETFSIKLRLFHGAAPSVVEARFRYRVVGGKLSMWYELNQPDEIERQAFEPMAARIEKETAIKVLI